MQTRWLKSLTPMKPSWLCLTVEPNALNPEIDTQLRTLGLKPITDVDNCYCLQTQEDWSQVWRSLAPKLAELDISDRTRIGVIGGETPPVFEEVEYHHKTVEEANEISEQMWLIRAITQDTLSCTYMPVVDSRGETFGYESLVRGVDSQTGDSISGGQIFMAGKILQIEYLVDRYLHELAIKGFVEQKLKGFLFINFIPGFIQRPEYYLDGLAQAITRYHFNAKQVVLDCTNSENPRDIQHLKSVAAYCRTQGYQIALDDIESDKSARRILKEMNPDFIKLDMRLVQKLPGDQNALDMIYRIATLVKHSGCPLIAEGVETEEIRNLLQASGVSLYQGYLFSPPQPRTKPAARKKA